MTNLALVVLLGQKPSTVHHFRNMEKCHIVSALAPFLDGGVGHMGGHMATSQCLSRPSFLNFAHIPVHVLVVTLGWACGNVTIGVLIPHTIGYMWRLYGVKYFNRGLCDGKVCAHQQLCNGHVVLYGPGVGAKPQPYSLPIQHLIQFKYKSHCIRLRTMA
jgi:hypothetical protein